MQKKEKKPITVPEGLSGQISEPDRDLQNPNQKIKDLSLDISSIYAGFISNTAT